MVVFSYFAMVLMRVTLDWGIFGHPYIMGILQSLKHWSLLSTL